MKKFLEKLSIGVLTVSMLAGLMTGCGKKEANSSDDEVVLKWVMGGPGIQKDSEKVWNLFNEKLAEVLPNTKVDFEVIATTDYAEKWKLIAASSEKVDIAWIGWMNDMADEVRNGSYLPLDDLLTNYAPKLKQEIPDWVWESLKYDGKIYAIPNYQMMVSTTVAIRTPEELADQYLDKERIKKAFYNWYNSEEDQMMTDEVFDAIEDYCKKLKDAGKLGLGVSPEVFNWCNTAGVHPKFETYGYAKQEKDGKVVIKDIRPLEEHFYKRIADLYQKGYIRKDALTVSDMTKDNGVKDGYIMWVHNHDDFTKRSEDIKYGMPIYYIPVTGEDKIVSTPYYKAAGTNTGITRTSENPERAMQLLEIINDPAHKDLYNLLVYGIEGEHYKKIDENRIETLDYVGNPTMESAYGIQKWIIGNTFNAYETQSDIPGYNDYIKNVLHKDITKNFLEGFKFDMEPVKNQIAQIKSIDTEYKGLKTGAYGNWKEMLETKHKKLTDVGLEKVIAEVQKQFDEQLNNK